MTGNIQPNEVSNLELWASQEEQGIAKQRGGGYQPTG